MKPLGNRRKVSNNPYRRLLHYLKVLSTLTEVENNTVEECKKLVSGYRGKQFYKKHMFHFLTEETIFELLEKRIPEFLEDYRLLSNELQYRGLYDLRMSFEIAKRKEDCEELFSINQSPSYLLRTRNLKRLGYNTYGDYLNSELWRRVRKEKLDKYPTCYCCSERAKQVHHRNYKLATLKGEDQSGLVTVCQYHHEKAEFNERGNKTMSIKTVNRRLDSMRRKYLEKK